ncbi:SMP-30/gluconolactonase/LRE family protein [Arthrobacter rhizosphaerae]|uniref:SMP-30/gluconolactonase/LRE family protein n=1 Tax=Arthrobacter rhizosphaerae TaxID=2855490 RepID=UPI001FF1921C|nr:SMP-30/gluconolactonase/LRE family protein [Arthrobacter rhizosphaerae]
MTTYAANVASVERHVLAEGPVWDASTEEVLWVDIVKGQVFEGHLQGDTVLQTKRHDFDGTVGSAVRSTSGDLLVAGQEQLLFVTSAGDTIPGPNIVPKGTSSRTNDGACDPSGRFLIGTLPLDERTGEEVLVRLEDSGDLTCIDNDLSLSNGLAWSPDGRLFYSTDTVPGIIWVRDYEPDTGAVGPRREHIRITDGFPDGICTDSRGNLWVAIWGVGEIRSFSPEGKHENTVTVPCPHPSSVAFVGPELDLLLITTASRDLSPADFETYPDAGRLFTAHVGVTGNPCSPWSGAGTTAASDL